MSRPSPREAPVSSTMRFFSEKGSTMSQPPGGDAERGGDQANGVAHAAETQARAPQARHLGRRRIAEILAVGKRLRLAGGSVGLELGQRNMHGARAGGVEGRIYNAHRLSAHGRAVASGPHPARIDAMHPLDAT